MKDELGVKNRIGATFGQVYCGVVGGIRRHEFSVLGAAVNLAARLMESPMNKGLLVDEAVREEANARFEFHSLQPVKAKGYDKPVATFEPLRAISAARKRGNSMVKFIGRQEERNAIVGFAREILESPSMVDSSVINVLGESGIGKVCLLTFIPILLCIPYACHLTKVFLCLLERTWCSCDQRSEDNLSKEKEKSSQSKIHQYRK